MLHDELLALLATANSMFVSERDGNNNHKKIDTRRILPRLE